jgi:hypothetical protein
MEINEGYSFTTVDENNRQVICDTLGVVNIEGENPIIIYTDYTLDENQKFNLYVSKIVKEEDHIKLEEIDHYDIIPEIKAKMDQIWNNIQPNI